MNAIEKTCSREWKVFLIKKRKRLAGTTLLDILTRESAMDIDTFEADDSDEAEEAAPEVPILSTEQPIMPLPPTELTDTQILRSKYIRLARIVDEIAPAFVSLRETIHRLETDHKELTPYIAELIKENQRKTKAIDELRACLVKKDAEIHELATKISRHEVILKGPKQARPEQATTVDPTQPSKEPSKPTFATQVATWQTAGSK